jgi:Transposase, Mutator family
MAEGHRMTAADLVDKLMSDEHADVLRDSVAWLVTQLMEAELGELAGAGFGERAPDRRQTQRNGYRPRRWDTRVGELQLASPAAMPEGPPGVARAFGCEARRAGPCVAELAGAPQGAQRASVAPLRVALGSGCTRRGPELPPGATRSGIARGLSPAGPSSPASPTPKLGGPVHGSCPGPGAGKRRAEQVRRNTQRWWQLLWSQPVGRPARCHRSARRQSAAERPVRRPP